MRPVRSNPRGARRSLEAGSGFVRLTWDFSEPKAGRTEVYTLAAGHGLYLFEKWANDRRDDFSVEVHVKNGVPLPERTAGMSAREAVLLVGMFKELRRAQSLLGTLGRYPRRPAAKWW